MPRVFLLLLLSSTLTLAAVGCARKADPVPTAEQAESMARRGLSLAQRIPRARVYVPPPPFAPTRPSEAERNEAIARLVEGREALAKKRWEDAEEAFGRALSLVPWDDDATDGRRRAAQRGQPLVDDVPTHLPRPRARACADHHATIEDLCACMSTSDEGEHCLPAPILCAFVGKQMPDGSLFVLRVGRDDGLGPTPTYWVAARRNDGFHAVALLAVERSRQRGQSADDIEIETQVVRTDGAQTLFEITLRNSQQSAGLVSDRSAMARRTIYCLPPTMTEPARCPVDVVTNRRAGQTPAAQTPPLPAKLAASLSRVTSPPPPPLFVHVGREITDTGIRTWLIDGKIDDLPPGTVGFHPFR